MSTEAIGAVTYEDVAERIVAFLRNKQVPLRETRAIPWDAFVRLSELIHETYEVPATTFTPMMQRLLFAIGFAHNPSNVVGVGTYVGYTFSWLLRNRNDSETAPFFQKAKGIDVDLQANKLARHNCAILGHGDRLTFADANGIVAITDSQEPIDLLYIDLDDPITGKAGYQLVLKAALPYLDSGALIIAHDPCVAKFSGDFASYHHFVQECERLDGPWILPIDACGLSIAVVR
jgi:predicted O-methyltransferase YrrM